MVYNKLAYGTFRRKLNRFIAEVIIHDKLEVVHIKNTGRLKELLVAGAEVILEESNNPKRKTKYSLIAVWKNGELVNIDSQVPNVVAYQALKNGGIQEIGQVDEMKREVTFQESRFDLYYRRNEKYGFIEVKGVTFEADGVAKFPDAPTKRGIKHVRELIKAVTHGYEATILFVIQMKGCHRFTPYTEIDADFAAALRFAAEAGVQVIAYDTAVTENNIILDKAIAVEL